MSNVDILDFTICDRCGMKFHKAKPPRLHEDTAERLRCPETGCGRTFKTQGEMGGAPSSQGATVWL